MCGLFGEPSVRIGAGPCAIEPCEPRQVRKEATVSSQFCVPQDHLAPLLFIRPVEKRNPNCPDDPSLASASLLEYRSP